MAIVNLGMSPGLAGLGNASMSALPTQLSKISIPTNTGGGLFSKVGNMFGANKLSGAQGMGISMAGSLVNKLGNSLISDGLSTGVGNGIANIGNTIGGIVGNFNPVLGGIISAGTGIIGGVVNRGWGYDVANADAMKSNTSRLGGISVGDDLASMASATSNLGLQGTGRIRNGWFTNKGDRVASDLMRNQIAAQAGALGKVSNAGLNLDRLTDNTTLATYSALGGYLGGYPGALQLMQHDDNIEAINNRTNAMYGRKINSGLHAFGGELGTNGADFTNGLLYVNAGGTHESNPYQGVQMGVDENGTPNLVEQGETVFDDYVFSNRMKVPEVAYKQLGLGGSLKNGITFADASKKIAKESEERPNDPISKAGLDEGLARLAMIQEAERQRQQAEEQISQFALGGPKVSATSKAGVLRRMKDNQKDIARLKAEKEASLPIPGVFGGGDFGSGAGGRFDLYPDYSDRTTFNEAFDAAYEDALSQGIRPEDYIFMYGEKPYKAEKTNNPLREVDNRLVGNSNRRSKLKREDNYQHMTMGIPGSGLQFAQGGLMGNLFIAGGPQGSDRDYNLKRGAYGNALQRAAIGAMARRLRGKQVRDYINDFQYVITPDTAATYGLASNSFNFPGFEYDEPYNSRVLNEVQAIAALPKRTEKSQVKETYVDAVSEAGRRARTSNTQNTIKKPTRTVSSNATDSSGVSATSKQGVYRRMRQNQKEIKEAKKRAETAGITSDILRGVGRFKKEIVQSPDANAAQFSGVNTRDPAYTLYGNAYTDMLNQNMRIQVPETPTTTGQGTPVVARTRRNPAGDVINPNATNEVGTPTNNNIPAESAANPELPFTPTDYRQLIYERTRDALKNTSSLSGLAGIPDKLKGVKIESPVSPTVGFDTESREYPTWMRYIPTLGAGIGVATDALGLTNKGDYSDADKIEAAADALGYTPSIAQDPTGNYMKYIPMDITYGLNQLAAKSEATDRGIQNTAGTRGAAMAGMLANGYNSQLAQGNMYRQALEYNDALQRQVEDFNRGTDQFNAQMGLEAAIANARYQQVARNARLSGLAQAAAMRDAIDQRVGAARSANLTNLFNSLGNIGRENFIFNQIESSKAANNGYSIRNNGVVDHGLGGSIRKRNKKGGAR